MTRLRASAALAACLALSAALPGAAQDLAEPAPSELAPRRVAVTVADSEAADSRVPEAIAEFLRLELSAGAVVRVLPAAADIAAASPDAFVALAFTAAGPAWDMKASGRLVGAGEPAFSLSFRLNKLSVADASAYLPELARAVATAFPPAPPRVIERVSERVIEQTAENEVARGVVLTIEAPPGTRLVLPGGKKATVDSGGSFSVELPQSTTYKYRAELPGRMPEDRVVFMDKADLADRPVLEPLPSWEFGVAARYVNLVMVPEALWYALPGRLFASAALESSALALVQSYSGFASHIRYVELRLGGGFVTTRADATLRLALTLEAAGRLEIGDGVFRASYLFPWSVAPGAELSVRLGGGWRVALASGLRVGPLPDGWDAETGTSPLLGAESGNAAGAVGSLYLQGLDLALGVRREL